jgi:hypothetical protein
MSWSHSPGSARVSRVGDGVLAIANFPFATQPAPPDSLAIKDCFGVTPKPGRRGDRSPISLIGDRHC